MLHCTSHFGPYGFCLALGLYTSSLTSIAWTQSQPAIDINFDSKVINVDQLGLPHSCSAESLLRLLPELLERPGENLSSYGILVEGVSVGEAGDAALIQLHIDDIDRLVVTESPIASFQNNGQGGTINIMLRRKAKQEDKSNWGKASLEALYPTNITPSAQFSHQGKNWLIRNYVMGEYYNPSLRQKNTVKNLNYEMQEDEKFWSQVVSSMLDFQPTKKDKFELSLSEYASNDEKEDWLLHQGEGNSAIRNVGFRKLTLQAAGKYQRTLTSKSKLSVNFSYRYAPKKDNSEQEGIVLNSHQKAHNLSGNVDYAYQWKGVNKPWQISLNTGITTNQNYSNDNQKEITAIHTSQLEIQSHSSHQMVYAKMLSNYGKWGLMTAAEYQFFTYHVQEQDEPRIKQTQKDITAEIIGNYHITPQHLLQIDLNRKLKRPENYEIYPARLYNTDYSQYIQGNPELKPITLYETKLNYIGHLHWNEHQLTLSGDVSYNYVYDIIYPYVVGGEEASGGLGMTQQYLSFDNIGNYHVLNGGLMARYRYRNFSLSLIGNSYRVKTLLGGEKETISSFNLSLMPAISLPDGFAASCSLVYHGKVEANQGNRKALAYATCNLGRDWGAWRMYLYTQIALTGDDEITYTNNVKIYSDLIKTVGGFGMIYYF